MANKPRASETTPTERRCGRYELRTRLGEGATSEVWRAHDPKLNRAVVIKLLTDPGARARFVREVQITAGLDHPHVVRVRDFGDGALGPFLVMDDVPGVSLKALEGPLAPPLAADAVRQAAEGIAHAHARGVLHGDVKPANLLASEAGHVWVSDFGCATQGAPEPGVVSGTPLFSAPEQLAGDGASVGVAADVYSLGATLYALLTGRAPLVAENLPQLWTQAFAKIPQPPSAHRQGISPELDAICLRCLEKTPADRYPSATALAKALGDSARAKS